MADTKKNIPQIRFKGFEEEWEDNKLGNIASKVTEKNSSLRFEETFTNSAEFGVVSQKDFFDHDITNQKNIGGYYVVKNDDFVYNPRISTFAPVGPINRNKLKRSGVMSPLYTIFRPHDIDLTFLEWFFKSNSWHSFMNFNGDSGARSDRFSIKDTIFWTMPILSPKDISEQTSVGNFFRTLDTLISNHQKKLESLRNLKKSCLAKMFPQNGSKVPEIRFKGFSGEWEEKKLGEICKITMGQSPDGNTYSNKPSSYILVQGNADLKNGWVSPRIWTTQLTKEAKKGDLIMSVRAPAGAMGKTNYDVVIGRGVAAINGNEFIFQTLTKMDLDGYWRKLSCGSTFESLNSNTISEASFLIPKEDKEQIAIANYFQNLDNMISTKEKEIEKLQNLKKSLLDKMFM